MELKWLEDFMALVRTGSFSRAADDRNVTQPAYSRRIRALEYWLGVALFDRSSFPVRLTQAGDEFLPRAQALIADINLSRQDLRLMHAQSQTAVRIVTLHTLAQSLLPRIAAQFAALHPEGLLAVLPSVQGIEEYFDMILSGVADVVLTYETTSLDLSSAVVAQLEVLRIGEDRLIPVASPALAVTLPEAWLDEANAPVPYLGYTSFAFSEKAIAPVLTSYGNRLRTVFESPLSESLRRVALEGVGVAWLPEQLIATDLAAGALLRLPGDQVVLPVAITAYRLRAPRGALVEEFWSLLAQRAAHVPPRDAPAGSRTPDRPQ